MSRRLHIHFTTKGLFLILSLFTSGCASRIVAIDEAARMRLLHAAQIVHAVDPVGGHFPSPFIDLGSPPLALTIVNTATTRKGIVVDSTIVRWSDQGFIESIVLHRDGVPIRRSLFQRTTDGLREIIRNGTDNRSALRDDTPFIDTVLWRVKLRGEAGCVTVDDDGRGDAHGMYCFCPDEVEGQAGFLTWELEGVSRYVVTEGVVKSTGRSLYGREQDGDCADDMSDPRLRIGPYVVLYGESDGPFHDRIATIDDVGRKDRVITRVISGLDEGETLSEKEIRERIEREGFTGTDTVRFDTTTGLPILLHRSRGGDDEPGSPEREDLSDRYRFLWRMREGGS